MYSDYVRDVCKNCGEPIIETVSGDWLHENPDLLPTVYCEKTKCYSPGVDIRKVKPSEDDEQ